MAPFTVLSTVEFTIDKETIEKELRYLGANLDWTEKFVSALCSRWEQFQKRMYKLSTIH